MKRTINRFIVRNRTLSMAIGFLAAIGGIALAYLTNDTEPWGTIGGIICALGIIFALQTMTARN